MSLKSFLITSLFLTNLTLVSAIPPGVCQTSFLNEISGSENLSKTKDSSNKKVVRVLRANLCGALCKECLTSLKDELQSEKGVKEVLIEKIVPKDNNESYAPIKIVYSSPTISKDDLIETIKFRDLYAFDVVDEPLKKHKGHR